MLPLQPIQGIDIYLLDQFLKGRLRPGMKVLDAGCGYGRNIRWLIEQGFDVTANDVNPEAIGQLKADFPGLADRFMVSSIEDFPLDVKYNFIICNAVLHFANGHEEFEVLFGQLPQLMQPGGLLFIRMTSTIGLEGRLENGDKGVYTMPDGFRCYLLTRPKVNDLLEQYGMKLIEPVKTVFVDGLRSMTTLVLTR